jgi:hypothetical protein
LGSGSSVGAQYVLVDASRGRCKPFAYGSESSPSEKALSVGGVSFSLTAAADAQLAQAKTPSFFLETDVLMNRTQHFPTVYLEDNEGALALQNAEGTACM